MSTAFPTDKDGIIDNLDDTYGLELTDEEYTRLRKLTHSELFLVSAIMARAIRKEQDKFTD